jgi:hypothetical protein
MTPIAGFRNANCQFASALNALQPSQTNSLLYEATTLEQR